MERNRDAARRQDATRPVTGAIALFCVVCLFMLGMLVKQLGEGSAWFFREDLGPAGTLLAFPARGFGLLASYFLGAALIGFAVTLWKGRSIGNAPRRAIGLTLMMLAIAGSAGVLHNLAEGNPQSPWGGVFGTNLAVGFLSLGGALGILGTIVAVVGTMALLAFGAVVAQDWFFYSDLRTWLGATPAAPAFAVGMGQADAISLPGPAADEPELVIAPMSRHEPAREEVSWKEEAAVAVLEPPVQAAETAEEVLEFDDMLRTSTADAEEEAAVEIPMVDEIDEDDELMFGEIDEEEVVAPALEAELTDADFDEFMIDDHAFETAGASAALVEEDTAEIWPVLQPEVAQDDDDDAPVAIAEPPVVATVEPAAAVEVDPDHEVETDDELMAAVTGLGELEVEPVLDAPAFTEEIVDEEIDELEEEDDDDVEFEEEDDVELEEEVEEDDEEEEDDLEYEEIDEEDLEEEDDEEVEEEDDDAYAEDVEFEEELEFEEEEEDEDLDEEELEDELDEEIEEEADEDEGDASFDVDAFGEVDELEDEDEGLDAEEDFEFVDEIDEIDEDDEVETVLEDDEPTTFDIVDEVMEIEPENDLSIEAEPDPTFDEFTASAVEEDDDELDEDESLTVAAEIEDAAALFDQVEELDDRPELPAEETMTIFEVNRLADEPVSPMAPAAELLDEERSILEYAASASDEPATAARKKPDDDWATWMDGGPAAGVPKTPEPPQIAETKADTEPEAPDRAAAGGGAPEPRQLDLFAADDGVDPDDFEIAVAEVLDRDQCSVSMLQRELGMTFAAAAASIEKMEREGIVGPYRGSGSREILTTKAEWEAGKD